MVTIQSRSATVVVPRGVLEKAGDYFKACMTSGMKEAKTGIINMEDVDDKTLKLFYDFLHKGQLNVISESGQGQLKKALSTAVDLVIFGERIQSKVLQSKAIGELDTCLTWERKWNLNESIHKEIVGMAPKVYNGTPEKHQLRRLIALHAAHQITSKDNKRMKRALEELSSGPIGFFADVFYASRILGVCGTYSSPTRKFADPSTWPYENTSMSDAAWL